MPFQIGDRVETVVDHPEGNPDIMVGMQGTVCELNTLEAIRFIGVMWDMPVKGGHTCDHNCPNGYGWRVWPDRIKAVQDARFHEDESLIGLIQSFRR